MDVSRKSKIVRGRGHRLSFLFATIPSDSEMDGGSRASRYDKPVILISDSPELAQM